MAATTDKPARRALDYRTFDDLVADVERLRDRGYRRAGNWTLAQACDHVGAIVAMSMDGFTLQVPPWYVRLIAAYVAFPLILARRRMPTGLRGPEETMPQGPPGDDAAAAGRFLDTIARYRAFAGPLHPSPVFGRLSRHKYDQLTLIHAAHHLSFLVPSSPTESP